MILEEYTKIYELNDLVRMEHYSDLHNAITLRAIIGSKNLMLFTLFKKINDITIN